MKKILLIVSLVVFQMDAQKISMREYLLLHGQPQGPIWDLSKKNIANLDGLQDIQDPLRIRVLNLANNNLTQVPFNIFEKFVNLEKLDLSNNEIAGLPAGIFDNLVKLKELNVANNKFNTVPKHTFDNLINLEVLNGITKSQPNFLKQYTI